MEKNIAKTSKINVVAILIIISIPCTEGTSGAEEKGDEKAKSPDSSGSMQREAMNNDGTTHDAHKGVPKPSNKTQEWLDNHGLEKMRADLVPMYGL